MKTHQITAAFLLLVVAGLISCTKIDDTPKPTRLVFTVDMTKASWDASGAQLTFEVNDHVSLFSLNNDNVVLTVTSVSGDGLATLEGTGVSEFPIYALYPYNSGAHLKSGVITGYSSSSSQALTEAYPAEAISMAKVEGGSTTLSFKNLTTMFRIKYEGSGSGSSGMYNVTYAMLGGDLSINTNDGSIGHACTSHEVVFTNEFVSGHSYYYAVPPFSANYLYITVNGSTKTVMVPRSYQAGTIYNVIVQQ